MSGPGVGGAEGARCGDPRACDFPGSAPIHPRNQDWERWDGEWGRREVRAGGKASPLGVTFVCACVRPIALAASVSLQVCAVCTPGVSAGSCSHARPGTCWVCVCACVSALWLRALLWAILHLCFHAWFLESEFLEELLGPSAPTWLTARLAPSLSSPGPWQGHGAAPRPSCPPALTAARAGPPELRYSPFSFFGRALLGARAPSLRARCPGCPLQALGSGLGFPLSPAMGPASPLREPRCPVPQPAVPLQLDSAWSKNSMEPP